MFVCGTFLTVSYCPCKIIKVEFIPDAIYDLRTHNSNARVHVTSVITVIFRHIVTPVITVTFGPM